MKIVHCLLIAVALAACDGGLHQSARESANDYALEEVAMAALKEEKVEAPASAQADLKLIRTASIAIQVKDIEESSNEVMRLIGQHQAFIGNDHFENLPGRRSRQMQIRVPSDRLEALLEQLALTGEYVESRNMNVRDVSEEFVDTEIRIKSKKAVHAQYLKLLDRAAKMEDILKIEREIRQITEEIEAREGRLRYLKDQVALGTIHLSMYQEVMIAAAPPAKSYWLKAWEQLGSGWDMVKSVSLGLIAIWPFIIMVVSGILVIRYFRGRKTAAAS